MCVLAPVCLSTEVGRNFTFANWYKIYNNITDIKEQLKPKMEAMTLHPVEMLC